MGRMLCAAAVCLALPLACDADPAASDAAMDRGTRGPLQFSWPMDDSVRLSLWTDHGDPYTPPTTLFLGGVQAEAGVTGIMRCHPYGYYDAGTCLDLQATGKSWTNSRPGINGGFEPGSQTGHGGTDAMARDGDFDYVNLYNGVSNISPVLVLSDVAYDATHILPPKGTRFSAKQLESLRRNMWVLTNSVDPSVMNTACGTCIRTMNVYGSYITGWASDGSSITVTGWVVPGAHNNRAHQVPSSVLDTYRSRLPVQTAFLGSQTTAFARNTVLSYTDAARDPSIAGSQIHALRGEELDFFNYSTEDYSAQFQGYTVTMIPLGTVRDADGTTHSVRPTSDSYDMLLAGPTPNLLRFNGAPDANYIQGESILVRGYGGVSSRAGDVAEMFEHSAHSGTFSSFNNMRVAGWLHNETGATGYSGTSVHLGLIVDGTQGNVASGTRQGDLVFDPQPGTYGTGNIGLFGYNGTGLVVGGTTITLTEPLSSTFDIAARNLSATGQIAGSSNILTGAGASLILRTPSGGTGGTLNSDAAGDVVVGTQVAGGRLVSTLPVKLPSYTVSSLPNCTRAIQDTLVAVVDARSPAYRGTLTGGGTTHTPAYCDGSAWTAH